MRDRCGPTPMSPERRRRIKELSVVPRAITELFTANLGTSLRTELGRREPARARKAAAGVPAGAVHRDNPVEAGNDGPAGDRARECRGARGTSCLTLIDIRGSHRGRSSGGRPPVGIGGSPSRSVLASN